MPAHTEILPTPQRIQSLIHEVRGWQVMLDSDLAAIYGVETKNLKRQVKRNISRFPADFMIELTREEYNFLRCQFGTLEKGRGTYSKFLPYAFTEAGVAMLSSVLSSEAAVQVNIQIMRAFTELRNSINTMARTALRQDKLETEVAALKQYVEDILCDQNDINENIAAQLEAISLSLSEMAPKTSNDRPRIGFKIDEKQ